MRALRELGGHAPVALGHVPSPSASPRLRAGLRDRRLARATGQAEADFLARLAIARTPTGCASPRLSTSGGAPSRPAGPRAPTRALALGLDGLKNAYAYLG